MFLTDTLVRGVVLIVNVTLEVCKPKTGLDKSVVAVVTTNGVAVEIPVEIDPVNLPVKLT
jgi:hypothetical protein